MKKAIKVLSIIFAVLTGLSFIGMLIVGFSYSALATNKEFVQELVNSMNNTAPQGVQYTYEQVAASLELVSFFAYAGSLECALSCGLNIAFAILASKEKEYSKYVWIVLGIIGIFFTNIVVCILAIIYGAKLSNDENNSKSTVQEVKFTEKVNDSSKPNPSDYDAPDHLD